MKNSWHKFQRYYFSFNRSDRNAITILSVSIFIVLVGIIILPYLILQQPEDFSEIKALFDAWEKEQHEIKENQHLSLYEFDPNTILESKLDSLDLPVFVKQNMVRYREAGGKFKSAEDLKKIYGMTDSVYQIIRPYVQVRENYEKIVLRSEPPKDLNEDQSSISIPSRNEEQKPSLIVTQIRMELNSADSSDLVQLPGIGPVFSKRIVRYRDLLGGYVKKEQLLEVYNFPVETFEDISDMLEVDSLEIKKLRINFIGYSELIRHPYLNKEQVVAILNWIDKNGPFKNLMEVASVEGFDPELFDRIRPYLTCE